ncbi:type II toxin-antitoxin system VapC family toxin [soil metagenome]
MTALLDVNVLIALFDETHVHHEVAHDWFADHSPRGWATCAVTQNGFLRIMTDPRSAVLDDGATVFASLRTLCRSSDHTFWPETVSLLDESLFDTSVLVSARQITDVYLLGLAVRMGGRLATFDRTIPWRAVKPATAGSVAVLEPA